MAPSRFLLAALLSAIAGACVADDVSTRTRISIPSQPGVGHEQVVAVIRQALGLVAADSKTGSDSNKFEVPNLGNLPKQRMQVHPVAVSEERLAPSATKLTYTRGLPSPASSLDMGPPRGPVVFITTTVDVDTSSVDAVLISVSTQGRDRAYNEHELRNVMSTLTALSHRRQPWAVKP